MAKNRSHMEMKLLYRIHVTGRVQGVGYRWSAADEARKRGITGYVKNLDNGSVYIEAEGSEEMLNEYVRWCKSGPPMSYVTKVETDTCQAAGYNDFRIRY